MFLLESFRWVSANSHALLEILGAAVALATVITKLTRSPKDDASLAKFVGLLRRFSLLGYRDEVRSVPMLREPPLLQRRLSGESVPPKAEKL